MKQITTKLNHFTGFILLCIILCSCNPGGTPAPTLCDNGGLENNNWTNWKGYYGGVGNPAIGTGFIFGAHTIMTAGSFDPYVGGNLLPVVPPNGGLHSARLGDKPGPSNGHMLRYYFTINNTNKNFRFQYALVMYDAGWHPTINPRARYKIYVKTFWNYFQVYSSGYITGLVGDPFFDVSPVNPRVVYRNWTCVRRDLSPWVGKEAYIEFTVEDCGNHGPDHYCMAYIDGVCSANGPACIPPSLSIKRDWLPTEVVIADGSATTGELNHYWSIQEVDYLGTPIPGQFAGGWYTGPAGTFNCTSFWQSTGRSFVCDKYYRIELAVHNECCPWVNTTKMIHIVCP